MNNELANDLGNLCQRSLSLIAKNCGGVLPRAARLTEDDAEHAGAGEALPDCCAAMMDRQALNDALEEIWKVIRAANAYIDRQAPWALKKTDPARMEFVLRVLVGCRASGRDNVAALHAGEHGPHAGPTRRAPRMRANSRRWRTPLAAGTVLPAPQAYSRVTSKRRRKKPDADRFTLPSGLLFAEESPTMLARACEAGVGEVVTIGTRLSRAAEQIALAESRGKHLVHGRHPSAPCGRRRNAGRNRQILDTGFPSQGDRRRRGGAGLLLRPLAARHAGGGVPPPNPRRAPAGVPICIHTRDADDDSSQSCRTNATAAVISIFCCIASAAAGRWRNRRVAIGGYVSFSGILTFPKSSELRAIAADFRRSGCWWKPIAPISRRCRSAASATSRPMWPHTASVLAELRGLTPEALAELTTAISAACSARRRRVGPF